MIGPKVIGRKVPPSRVFAQPLPSKQNTGDNAVPTTESRRRRCSRARSALSFLRRMYSLPSDLVGFQFIGFEKMELIKLARVSGVPLTARVSGAEFQCLRDRAVPSSGDEASVRITAGLRYYREFEGEHGEVGHLLHGCGGEYELR